MHSFPRPLLPTVAVLALGLLPLTAPRALPQNGAVPTITVKDRIGVHGIGPVKVGMPLLKAIDASQTTWTVGESLEGGNEADTCRHAHPKDAPSGLDFMIVGGKVARVEADTPGLKTQAGAQVGDTEARIRSLYPGIKTQPHHYETGHYLIYTPKEAKDKNYRLIFETDGKKVTRYRAGILPAVEWIEGCA